MSVEGRARSYQRPSERWDAVPSERLDQATPEQRLDMALAWTAHELRGPVLAARAALDRVLVGDSVAGRDRRLVARSRDVLRELSGQIDSVLRWAGRGTRRGGRGVRPGPRRPRPCGRRARPVRRPPGDRSPRRRGLVGIVERAWNDRRDAAAHRLFFGGSLAMTKIMIVEDH